MKTGSDHRSSVEGPAKRGGRESHHYSVENARNVTRSSERFSPIGACPSPPATTHSLTTPIGELSRCSVSFVQRCERVMRAT